MKNENKIKLEGNVEKQLANGYYNITSSYDGDDITIIGYLSGKLRNKKTVMAGDKVLVEAYPQDIYKGRIVKRL